MLRRAWVLLLVAGVSMPVFMARARASARTRAPALAPDTSPSAMGPAARVAARSPDTELTARAIVLSAHAAAEAGTLRDFVARWAPRARDGEPAAWLALGVAAHLQYAFPRADSLLRHAGAPPRRARFATTRAGTGVPASDVARWAGIEHARLRISEGNVAAANVMLQRAAQDADRAADSMAHIEILLLQSALALKAGAVPLATALLDRTTALGIARSPRLLAIRHCRRAGLISRRGEVSVVRAAVDSGIAAAREAGSRRLEAACEFVRATLFARLGHTDSLRVSMARTIQLQRLSHDLPSLAAALQWEGFYLLTLGRHELASRRLSEAWDLASAAHSVNVQAWTALNRATLASTLNDHREASHWLERADSLMQRIDDIEGRGYVLGMRAELAFDAGDTATGWRRSEETVRLHRRAGDVLAQQAMLARLTSRAVALGELHRAEAMLDTLDASSAGRRDVAYATSRLVLSGEVALLRGDAEGALAAFDTALSRMHATQHHFRHQVSVMRALALLRLDRVPDARRAARDGEARLNAWRATLTDSALRSFATRIEQGRRPYYTALVSALAARGELEDAIRLAESQQARRLREQLAEAGGWSGTEAGRTVAATLSPSVAEMQRRLPDARTALLEFVAGRGPVPSLALVITRDTVWATRVPAVDSLSPGIQRLLAQLASGRPLNTTARDLGRALLDPVLPMLDARDVSRLVIVADDALHLLPFDALVLPSGTPAIERWEISYAPSLTLATALWTRQATPRATGGIVAFADPDVQASRATLFNGPRLAPLPGARSEVRAIRAAHPSTVMRLGASATETSLRQLGTRTGDVLHIAAHGIVRAWDGRGAALVLAADGQADGVLYAGEVAALTLRARLVVLSACSTDAGDLVRGEGVSGLTSAFLRSGAQAVVTSAWRVDDAGTARLMRDFYGALARGATTGGALRSAQRAARTRGDPPALWAAFRVVGNASLVPRLVADAN